jgi:hypothetical protein
MDQKDRCSDEIVGKVAKKNQIYSHKMMKEYLHIVSPALIREKELAH